MQPAVLDEAHAYWFGDLAEFASFPDDRFRIWFGGGPEIDAEICARFGDAVETAGRGDVDPLLLSASQQVGLVLLLDQFSRNLHRQSPLAYSYDQQARAYAAAIVADGLDRFKLIERAFVILPFGHSEDIADQQRVLALLSEHIEPFAPPGNRFYEAGKIQSRKYHDIIARFGRFPHRNATLGRETTAEEAAFLATTNMAPF